MKDLKNENPALAYNKKNCITFAIKSRIFLTCDKEKFVTLLGGHLSPKLCFYDQILPQIASFVILGTWDMNSGKRSFSDIFMLKNEENKKSQEIQNLTPDAIMLWS